MFGAVPVLHAVSLTSRPMDAVLRLGSDLYVLRFSWAVNSAIGVNV